MAGTVFTIIENNWQVTKEALTAARVSSDIRVQPINTNQCYLLVRNKRKSNAEADLMRILANYKGQEFSSADTDLRPTMASITNDAVRYRKSPDNPVYLNDAEWCAEHGIAAP